jgi:peptidyl-tRNA hydrolase
MADSVKQVIVINPHTGYNTGKMMAQCAHASVLSLLQRGTYKNNTFVITDIDDDFLYWMKTSFVKIIYKASSEKELWDIKTKAEENKILTYSMIEDDGIFTALALKPCRISFLDFLKPFGLKLA